MITFGIFAVSTIPKLVLEVHIIHQYNYKSPHVKSILLSYNILNLMSQVILVYLFFKIVSEEIAIIKLEQWRRNEMMNSENTLLDDDKFTDALDDSNLSEEGI